MKFLDTTEHSPIPFNTPVSGLERQSLFLGKGNPALEVVVFTSTVKPTKDLIRSAWKKRRAGRATPVLAVVLHDDMVVLCGSIGQSPPIIWSKDFSQAERLCDAALNQPDRNAAIRYLDNAMPSLETELPGINNKGLLAQHELAHGTHTRGDDWQKASDHARTAIGSIKKDLLSDLGFTVERLDNLTHLLKSRDQRTALAVLLEDSEVAETGAERFNNLSPVSYAMTKADNEGLRWVVMVQGERIRLYATKNTGVGRRGRTETFVECQPSLLASDDIGFLWLLFSADALCVDGSLSSILDESKRFAVDVARGLRERIYDIVVPKIAIGIAKTRNISNPTKEDMALTQEMALVILFRLLFIAYAEDLNLLPYHGNESYKCRSLKAKAQELATAALESRAMSNGDHHWTETAQLWKAVSFGNREWGVPAYNGTIFSSDSSVSKAGAELNEISLPNEYFEEALRALLLTGSHENDYAPIDFRSLSVREFGKIYEGLLESELSVAEQDLTKDKKGIYLPAKDSDEVFVQKGEIYLHDRSGARKSSGSYYSPDFVVEHLLDSTLEPALDSHFKHLESLGDADRAEQFFDFRVADIAMGSGHFLVAAIDRIERRFSMWLENNPIPGVQRELYKLRNAARKQLGELAEQVVIEDGQLLRRMIARRCIYGVDLNHLTVQLARLSIWIHTFVPGLPLSLLDHKLVHGNALIGVGSLDEIRRKFDEVGDSFLFKVDADNLLGQAAEPLLKLAQLSDASLEDIEQGRALMKEARFKTLETRALCDLITAQPVATDVSLKKFFFHDWESQKKVIHNEPAFKLAREILEPLSALHFPVAFPEVFLGRNKGFDVILGNPPWEKVKVEEYNFWAHHFPGLRGLTQREFEYQKKRIYIERPDLLKELNNEKERVEYLRKILHSSTSYIMGAGDSDLYKAFSWRFWHLIAPENGKIGVVLPRSVMAAKGSEVFRKELFNSTNALNVTTLQNTGRWIFDIHPQFTIILLSISKSSTKKQEITIQGPFTSKKQFLENQQEDAMIFPIGEILSWNDTASLPLFPHPNSAEVFSQLRQAPRLDLNDGISWRARPDRELDATVQKSLMDLVSEQCPKGFWPVYKGASFDIWNPDTGKVYAWADPKVVLPWLQNKRLRANKGAHKGVHKEFSADYVQDQNTLASLEARIAFRDVTNRTNSRTIVASLIPPRTFITHTCPCFLFPRGDKKDEAFLLGILCSIPLDWYARSFIETHVTFFIINPFPIPRPERDNLLCQRVVALAGRLACPDERFADWAAEVGVKWGPLDEDDKEDKIRELDAVVAHLYSLSETQLVHIFETFHKGWDYEARLREVLKHYQTWKSRI
ncbi:MAG: hypothetical protein HRT36_00665 [Alphaproteobacteria bacterium]|nr:hypothetical protein [Alphaproteobacteria bacterium]